MYQTIYTPDGAAVPQPVRRPHRRAAGDDPRPGVGEHRLQHHHRRADQEARHHRHRRRGAQLSAQRRRRRKCSSTSRTRDGNFDYAAYQAALNNPDADWTAVGGARARSAFPVREAQQLPDVAGARVGRGSAPRVRRAEHKARRRTTSSSRSTRRTSAAGRRRTPTCKAYYDAHPDQFKDVEKRLVEFVRIPIDAVEAKTATRLSNARTRIRNDARRHGDHSRPTSKTYSEAQTATVGGETGLLGKTQRDPAVMAAADALKPGEISQPIVTADGVYVVQLIEKKKDKTEDQVQPARAVHEAQRQLGHAGHAGRCGACGAGDRQRVADGDSPRPPRRTDSRSRRRRRRSRRASRFPGLGFFPAVSRFAFAAEPGAVSAVISDERNYVVCRLKERTPAAVRPLARGGGRHQADADSRPSSVTQAMHKADGFVRSAVASPASTFDNAAVQYGYQSREDRFVHSGAAASRNGAATPPSRARALALEANAVSKPIESGNSVYVITVVGRRDPRRRSSMPKAARCAPAIYRPEGAGIRRVLVRQTSRKDPRSRTCAATRSSARGASRTQTESPAIGRAFSLS